MTFYYFLSLTKKTFANPFDFSSRMKRKINSDSKSGSQISIFGEYLIILMVTLNQSLGLNDIMENFKRLDNLIGADQKVKIKFCS